MDRPKRARSRKPRKQPRQNLQLNLFSARGRGHGGNDAATTGREKSDVFIVPEGARKTASTVPATRGGMEDTASEMTGTQLSLLERSADRPLRSSRTLDSSAMSMEAIADQRNLLRAFATVAANKGAPGPDQETIERVRVKLSRLIPTLSEELLAGSYRPGKIRRVWIPKPGGKRGLGIPNVIDRVVQQAVAQRLSPQFETIFHGSSHGFRPQRSCHSAIAEAVEHLEAGAAWVVDIDLEQFFDRVNHQRLLARLGNLGVNDARVLRLIHRMLKAEVVLPDGLTNAMTEGTPQGGPLSPLLSNVVLDELDWELERRGLRFVRYADDCNIYVRTRRAGTRVMASIRRFIERKLRLSLNDEKSAVARPVSRHFLGFALSRRRKGVTIQLSKKSERRLWATIRSLTPRTWGRPLAECIARINEYLRGWIGYFGIGGKQLRQQLRKADSHIRRRLRAILIRQRGRPRHILRWLIQRGVERFKAGRDVYGGRKSLWALSISEAAHLALPVAYFRARGLLEVARLLDREKRHRLGLLRPR